MTSLTSVNYPTYLEVAYRHFTNDCDEMDVNQFLEFAKECHLLDKRLSKSEISTIFAKSADPERKIIDFSKFKENFSQFALKKGVSKNDIVKKIEILGKNLMFQKDYSEKSSVNTLSRPEVSTFSDISAHSNTSI